VTEHQYQVYAVVVERHGFCAAGNEADVRQIGDREIARVLDGVHLQRDDPRGRELFGDGPGELGATAPEFGNAGTRKRQQLAVNVALGADSTRVRVPQLHVRNFH
jgi:hypothetical protein